MLFFLDFLQKTILVECNLFSHIGLKTGQQPFGEVRSLGQVLPEGFW